MPSEDQLIQVIFADVPRLDIERVCRVLIRIATHLEETHYEEFPIQEQRQQQKAVINGMAASRVKH